MIILIQLQECIYNSLILRPVISLYGSKKAPSESDLSDIDVLVYYIRDVGTRFYTYIWTMTYCMEAAAKYGK